MEDKAKEKIGDMLFLGILGFFVFANIMAAIT